METLFLSPNVNSLFTHCYLEALILIDSNIVVKGERALNVFLNIVLRGIYSVSIVFSMNSCVILPIEDVIPYKGAWMNTYSTLCRRASHRIILMCWFDYNSEKLFWCFVSKRWWYIPGTMKLIIINVEFPSFLVGTLAWIKSISMFNFYFNMSS